MEMCVKSLGCNSDFMLLDAWCNVYIPNKFYYLIIWTYNNAITKYDESNVKPNTKIT